MSSPSINIHHDKPVSVNVVAASDHVVIYKLWVRQSPADAWKMAGQGTTEGAVPDSDHRFRPNALTPQRLKRPIPQFPRLGTRIPWPAP